MVMQDGGQQEPQDQLDQDQQNLDDQAAGEPAAPQFVTMEQFTQMQGGFQQERQTLMNHISGLESRIDKGANTLRAELQAQEERLARQNQEALQRQILEGIDDPDQKALWQKYFDGQASASPAVEPPVVQPAPQQQQATAADWAQVQAFVQQMGANPNDPRIDYNILVNTSMTPEARQQAFLSNVGTVVATPQAGQAPQQQQAQQAPPQPQSPTRPAGPVGSGYRNADDLMDAFITGNITQNKYQELAPGFGIPL